MKPARKNDNRQNSDWSYDKDFIESTLEAKKEVDQKLKNGEQLVSLDDLLEEFKQDDKKKIQD